MDHINRRTFLNHGLAGLGSLAFSQLFASDSTLQIPHYRPKIKRVIHLCMAGGPSHLESFDYKPELAKLHGKAMPSSFTKGQQLAQLQNTVLKARGSYSTRRPIRTHGISPWFVSSHNLRSLIDNASAVSWPTPSNPPSN